MSYPTIGQLHPQSTFSDFTNTLHDFLYFTVENELPVVHFQPAGTNTWIKVGKVPDWNSGYVIPEDGQFRLITYTNVATLAMAYYDQAFRNWLNLNHYHHFTGLSIPLVNGNNNNYSDLIVFSNPNSYDPTVHKYEYITEHNNTYPHTTVPWTQLDLSSLDDYLNSISNLRVKLYNGPQSWFNSDFENHLGIQYGTVAEPAGSTGATRTTEPVNLVFDQVYDASYFESFSTTFHDFVLLNVDNNEPTLTFQAKSTDTHVCHCIIRNSNPSTGYVLKEGSQYRFLGYSNVSCLGMVYIGHQFKQWLCDNDYLHLFETVISLNNGTFKVLAIKGLSNIGTSSLIWIRDTDNAQWEYFDTKNIKSYIESVDCDIRFFANDNLQWYTPVVKDGVKDAHLTSTPISDFTPTGPTVTDNQGVNLIYAKSLYEESSNYFDAAINRLDKELQEEQMVAQYLSNADQPYVDSLQTFIDANSTIVEDKVSHIKTLRSNLETQIIVNKNNISANDNLNNLLNTTEAQTLTNNILELRNEVYESLRFLSSTNRLGDNNDVIYVISKTALSSTN